MKQALSKSVSKVRSAVLRKKTLLVLGIFLSTFLLALFLSEIPNAGSQAERVYIDQLSWKAIFENPLQAPHKILTLTTTMVSSSVRASRIVSLLFLLLTATALYYALRHWHEPRTAALATLAFATNSVTLGIARLGLPLITIMSFFVFAGLLLWHMHSNSNKFLPFITLVSLGALLYVPGFLWFMIIIGSVYLTKIKEFFVNVKRSAILLGIVCGLLLVTPLFMSFLRDINNLTTWLLLPAEFNAAETVRNVLRVPSAFLYRMPVESSINAGRLPVFDIASGILFLLGAQAYIRKIKLDRTRIMLGSALVATLAGALGQTLLAVTLLLPFVFCVVAAGIEYLFDEWMRVFPRNPVARSFGVIIMTACVMFSMYYQLSRFLIVWPQTPETRQTYDQARIIEPKVAR